MSQIRWCLEELFCFWYNGFLLLCQELVCLKGGALIFLILLHPLQKNLRYAGMIMGQAFSHWMRMLTSPVRQASVNFK